MRKLLAVLVCLALAALLALPAFAQERPNIPELLTDDVDQRFTTLLAAVEAAGLGETLAGEGPFTVFAPTNDAFTAALDFLGLSADELLADTETLTSILQYHVVPGTYRAAQMYGGLTIESAFDGAEITVGENDADGTLVANGTTVISDVDNFASNGVVHAIDSVLLPPGLLGNAFVRVAHFSPDTPGVDVYLNGEVSDVQGLEFGTVTDWVEVPAGVYSVAVAPAGTSLDEAAIGPASLGFAPGSFTTVAAIGSLEGGTLAPAVISENLADIPEGQARVTVFHAIEGAPAVDVLAGGGAIITNLAYPGTLEDNDGVFTLDVDADTYDLQVVPTGTTEPVLLDLPGTELAAGTAYLVAAIGTADAPQVSVTATDVASMMGQ